MKRRMNHMSDVERRKAEAEARKREASIRSLERRQHPGRQKSVRERQADTVDVSASQTRLQNMQFDFSFNE